MTTHILNISSPTSINNEIPLSKIFRKNPYFYLWVFGCLCYLYPTSPHKLAPCSTLCVFLRYQPNKQGYRCLNLSTCKIILSHYFASYPWPLINYLYMNSLNYTLLTIIYLAIIMISPRLWFLHHNPPQISPLTTLTLSFLSWNPLYISWILLCQIILLYPFILWWIELNNRS